MPSLYLYESIVDNPYVDASQAKTTVSFGSKCANTRGEINSDFTHLNASLH